MRLIVAVLPYAVSIRDFIHSGVFAELMDIPNTQFVIYTQNPELKEFENLKTSRVVIKPMREHVSSGAEALLRKLYILLFFDHFTYLQMELEGSRWKQLVAWGFVAARRILGVRRVLRIYGWLLRKVSKRLVAGDLISEQPDLLIGTRSTINSLDYRFLLEAATKGFKQITLASSWDNFTTKGFFPFPVNKTVVWNEKMASELREIFDVPSEDIVVAGYPRVAMLEDTGPFKSSTHYLSSLGLDKYRRFVLYSASYAELTREPGHNMPREYAAIREVVAEIEPRLPPDCCILVRLHPFSKADDENCFDGLSRTTVFVPGRIDQYVERVMNRSDEHHLAAQLQFAEAIVSMASTITIDAFAVRKPVVNIAFEPKGFSGLTIQNFYRFNHYRDLLAAIRPPLANNVGEVWDFVSRCLAGNKERQIDAAAFEKLYVPADSRRYPLIVRQTVEEMLLG
jgi:CDP-glycerol glycerophosphotransferase (TagB/SpsB family)